MNSIIVTVAAASRIANISPFQIEAVGKQGTDVYVQLKKGGHLKFHYNRFWNDFHAGRKTRGVFLAKKENGVIAYGSLLDESTSCFWDVQGSDGKHYRINIYQEQNQNRLTCECEDYKKQEKSEEVKIPFCKHCWAVVKYEEFESFQDFNEKFLKAYPKNPQPLEY